MPDFRAHIRTKLVILFLIFSGIIMAFAQIQKTELLEKKLAEKIDAYKLKKRAECKKEAIVEAEIYIDSILHRSMNSPLKDSVLIPPKPIPPFDSIQMDIDTHPVLPLLEKKLGDIQ